MKTTPFLTITAFTADAVQKFPQFQISGTATVVAFGETREMPATQRLESDGSVRCTEVKYLKVRYQTGTKVWAASATVWPSGNVNVDGGYHGNIRGKAPIVVGFWNESDLANTALGRKVGVK